MRTAVQNPPPVVAVAVAVAVHRAGHAAVQAGRAGCLPRAHCAGQAFPAGTRQLWFISDYLVLLLCVPLLNRLLHGLPRRAHKGVLLVLAVPLVVYPTVFGQDGILGDTAWMFLYDYLLAAYLRRWPDNRLSRLLNRPAAALVLGLGLPLGQHRHPRGAGIPGRDRQQGVPVHCLLPHGAGRTARPAGALALFHFFKNLDLGSNRFINGLAGTTLGVYILHQVPVLRDFLWNGIFHAQAHHGSAAYTLLVIVLTFAGCAAIDTLRTRFIMQPLQRSRAFTALCAKGDALATEIENRVIKKTSSRLYSR